MRPHAYEGGGESIADKDSVNEWHELRSTVVLREAPRFAERKTLSNLEVARQSPPRGIAILPVFRRLLHVLSWIAMNKTRFHWSQSALCLLRCFGCLPVS